MKTTRAIAAATLIASASANGSVAIVNYCTSDVYLWPVAGADSGSMITLPANNPTIGYKEEYRVVDNGNAGVSIKLSPNYYQGGGTPTHVVQFEYTVPPAGQYATNVFYDLSYVNSNPLQGWGITMQTSTGESATPCPHGTCMPGDSSCDIAYNFWNDDSKTHACGIDNDIIISLCSNAGGSLAVPKGLIAWNTKRDAEAEPEAESESDPLAVCVGVNGGLVGLCDEPAPAPSSTSSSSSSSSSSTPTPTPTPTPTTTQATQPTVAAVQALQKPASSSSSSSVAPAATAPSTSSNTGSSLIPQSVSLDALTNWSKTPVTTWLSYNSPANTKREANESEIKEKREAHLHNHMNFHRRNRIIKASA